LAAIPGPAIFLFQIETDGKQTLTVLDGTTHLSARRKVIHVIGHNDVRLEGVAAPFTVSGLVV